tara:strand:- start:1508 stop:2239 length:732 start_codon:yes stop_codon:yes gene_type:complete
MLLNIFPKSIYVSDDYYHVDEQLLGNIKEYEKGQNPEVYKYASEYRDFGNSLSTAWLKIADDENATLWNATSLNRYVLNDEHFSGLRRFIQGHIDNYVYNVLELTRDVNFYITQSWIVYNNEMSSVFRHVHNNSLLTGVFYIQGDYCPISFHHKDSLPFSRFQFQSKKFNLSNSNIWRVENEKEKLLLFPSDLEHSVEPNESKLQRISLAFNTFVKGDMGSEDDLNSLQLEAQAPSMIKMLDT